MENILLTNVPDFVDQWVLQSTPCGNLIEAVDVNPHDPSKVMLRTHGRENAVKIASTLDNYNLYGAVIRARYAFLPTSGQFYCANSDTTCDAIRHWLTNAS